MKPSLDRLKERTLQLMTVGNLAHFSRSGQRQKAMQTWLRIVRVTMNPPGPPFPQYRARLAWENYCCQDRMLAEAAAIDRTLREVLSERITHA